MSEIKETIKKVKELASLPLSNDRVIGRVEIVMLKFKEPPEIIDKAISRIIHNTEHPFKLTIFDNRPNTANTSKIWNKLVRESMCDYVLIMDSDAYVPEKKTEPCWLSRMMESIEETGVVIPVSSASGGQDQRVDGPEEYPSSVINKGIWSGYCFLFKKSVVLDLPVRVPGPFDERFYIYGQDSEWAHRVSKKLGGAVMRKDVYVEHIGGASFGSNPMRDADKVYARELFKFLTKK